MTEAAREPILRVVPRPGDINSNGHIFGGWVLSQMDIAGSLPRRDDARGYVHLREHPAAEDVAVRIDVAGPRHHPQDRPRPVKPV